MPVHDLSKIPNDVIEACAKYNAMERDQFVFTSDSGAQVKIDPAFLALPVDCYGNYYPMVKAEDGEYVDVRELKPNDATVYYKDMELAKDNIHELLALRDFILDCEANGSSPSWVAAYRAKDDKIYRAVLRVTEMRERSIKFENLRKNFRCMSAYEIEKALVGAGYAELYPPAFG